MLASDVAVDVPTVTVQTTVPEAVRVMTHAQLPGLIVVDDRGRPSMVVPGTQVLRMAVLNAYQEDPALVRTIDEAHADLFWQELGNRTIGDCLPFKATKPVTTPATSTLLELATLMARLHSPLVAVVDAKKQLIGGVTLNRLLVSLELSP